jgi:hypothetical protein
MPLSSVVGAQSIVKPGVCTSTTKPASPFDGQVIYMTDVDQTAVWDGSQWTVLAPIASGRNVIINGAMQVAQRGTSVASIAGNSYNTADRWNTAITNMGVWTQSVENDAPTGSGFRKSLKMLCTTADASPAVADEVSVTQIIEGQNLQQFLKGTSSAKQFTLSFWVKANVTGTYVVWLYDPDNTRHTSLSYTISASATWEKKIIIFAADTTGAFENDNGSSLFVRFYLGAGSDYTSGTLASTWASLTNANRCPSQTNLAAATSNYWQVTGVQLEAGAVATPFEFEDFGTTLAKCQRYYESVSWGNYYAAALSGTDIYLPVYYKVTKRATPTVTLPSSTNAIRNTSNANATPIYAWAAVQGGTDMFNIYAGSNSIIAINAGTATVAIEL